MSGIDWEAVAGRHDGIEKCPHCDSLVYSEDDVCPLCMQEMHPTYTIIRFHFEGENEVIAEGLTLEEVQEHCNRDDTHGEGWFDGWTKE